VRIDPYDATLRELAAATAIESGRLEDARFHLRALTLIEPDRPQHALRLERLDAMIREGGAGEASGGPQGSGDR